MFEVARGTVRLPLIIYDGQCPFCCRWVERAKSITGGKVEYAPSQKIGADFPQIERAEFGKAVYLVEPDGRISRGAEAVFRALKLGRRYPLLAWMYERVPGFAVVSEALYHAVATHRNAADRIDMLLIGPSMSQASYLLTRQIFLRGLGVLFFIAFASLWPQVDGLIGHQGILPVRELLDAVGANYGPVRYRLLPTLCWINSSDAFLHFLIVGGAVASLLLTVGIAQLISLLVVVPFYLSLVIAGRDFLGFQWDALLLETGFLAIFLAPARLVVWPLRRTTVTEPSRAVILLVRWLLFRLMFMSGVVKLTSGDATWRGWSALRYHYMTQPLPPWTAWYFFQLPAWFQKLSCGVVFFCELLVPFLYFTPRRPRLLAFWITIGFQSLILMTGNYGFFNFLTILLCFLLPDDLFWRAVLGRSTAAMEIIRPPAWRAIATLPLAVLVLTMTVPILIAAFDVQLTLPAPVQSVSTLVEPFEVFNSYGLFAIMTTQRQEIVIEGSDDERVWKAYEFKYKPGDVMSRPVFTAPYMPRLDWQMWFAALSNAYDNPWFVALLDRLREGSSPVLALLKSNPFPEHPPRYIRARLFDYQMTNFAERRASGAWWRRRETGLYFPASGE